MEVVRKDFHSGWIKAMAGEVVLGPFVCPSSGISPPHFSTLLMAQEAESYRLHHLWLPFGFGLCEALAEDQKAG